MKKRLTVRGIAALKPAAPGKRYDLWDTEVPGLGVRVTNKGKLTFNVMRRIGPKGAPVRRVVGEHRCGAQYTEGMLTQAREAARAALQDMARGVDPKQRALAEQERAAERRANTFASVAEDFIWKHVASLRSGAEVEAEIRRELIPAWGDRPIIEISRRDVVRLLERVAEGRPYVAHHLLAYLSKLFSWAILRDVYGLQSSPVTRGLGAAIIGAKKPRQRVLTDQELCCLWTATAATGAPWGPFVRLLLVTGQRLREVANAKWCEVDLDGAMWTIPAERMKGRAAHEVPLSPLAVEILRAIPQRGPYVFSTAPGRSPIAGFAKAKTRLDGLLGDMPPWVFHDLRRTMRTRLSGLPVPDNVAERIIAHAPPGLHKVYDQHGYRDEKRRGLELWAGALLSIVEPERGGNVVRLATARG
ncbi:MAG TPA: tyrosine-type recombinase/integrase [Roseiarcus sp.]|nr:tyrosine-type recombinase/integrase [Roseiarcus sp.]